MGMDHLSATFAALADPTRRAILSRLALGEAHVGELARPFRISAPAVSRHLRVLADAGLIERQVSAQWRILNVRAAPLREAADWLSQYQHFWEENLDRLAAYLEAPPQPAVHPTAAKASPPKSTNRPGSITKRLSRGKR